VLCKEFDNVCDLRDDEYLGRCSLLETESLGKVGTFVVLTASYGIGGIVKEDSLLIDETLAGDPAAYGQLVQKYQDRLFNTLYHALGSREEAEDVVQDAFVQAYVKLENFQRTSAFYTWLYRIAFNVSVSRRRRKRPEISVEQTRDKTGTEPVSSSEEVSANLEREEGAQQVHAALAQLSEQHRKILVLREMEGCCYESIAEMLDLPVGTVRSRLHRARLQLKEELKKVYIELE
jgi:RNA polymerase sigma-70 factor (ECF subfamily)